MGVALSIANVGMTSVVGTAYVLTPTAVHTFASETEVELVEAEDSRGMGAWVYRFGEGVTEGAIAMKLNVLGRMIKLVKECRTTLTWISKSVSVNVGG